MVTEHNNKNEIFRDRGYFFGTLGRFCSCNHSDVQGFLFSFTRSNIRGLCVDTNANKLYVACKSVLELNLDGSGERIAFDTIKSSIDLGEPTIYQGKFYFAASGYGETGIYTATLDPNKTVTVSR